MNYTIWRRIVLLLLALTLLTGCTTPAADSGATTPPTVEPTIPEPTEAAISFSISSKSFAEKYGDYYDSKRSFTTCVDGITYHFDVKIDEPTRLSIIRQSQQLVDALTADFPGFPGELTLCFRPGDYPARALDHTLYIGLDHLGTAAWAVGTAVAVFGHDVNYGILWAHGMETAKRLGFAGTYPEISLDDALSLREDAPEYLDLSYPCFLDVYTSADLMPRVHSLSLSFYNYLRTNGHLNLLTEYSDQAYCTHLSAFLAENGKEGYDNADLQNTVFYFGGPLIRLVWENEDGAFYLEDGFETQYETPHLPDRMNSDYALLRQTIVDYMRQADYMESVVGQYETDSTQRVDVLFASGHATDRYSLANYTSSENLIRMFCAEPFLHEYTHYLLRDTGMELWLNELICYYYGYVPREDVTIYMWESEIAQMDAATGVSASFIQSLKSSLEHTPDMTNADDFVHIFTGYLALYESYGALTDPDSGAEAKVSFLRYLADIAGEEAAVAAIVADDPETTFGKDWETLIADWMDTVQKEFKWIADYYYVSGG